jgi:hypothetical protein
MPGLSDIKFISPGNPTTYVRPAAPPAMAAFPFTMASLFSNNAKVFYQPGSLSVSSGGTVVNAGRKAKRI